VAWSNSCGSVAMHFGSVSPSVYAVLPLRLGSRMHVRHKGRV
jgi:hypothetical protein